MGNDTMRNRQEVPAEDPLAELARMMGQEDEFADLLRQSQAARRPATPASRAPQSAAASAPPPRPVAPRAPAEAGRPAPGSFAALAAEVYSEGTHRPASPAPRPPERPVAERPAEPRAPLARAPEPRPAEPRAPYVPPRPQPTEPRRPAPSASFDSEQFSDNIADAVSRALGQPFDPAAPSPRSQARAETPRPDAPRAEAPRAETPRVDAPRAAAARVEAEEGAPPEARLPSWMARSAAAARAAEAPASAPSATARGQAPRPGQAFEPDEDAYDYGRSAADYDDGDAGEPDSYEVYEVDEDLPRRGRRRLLLVGVAVIALVAAGAGAIMFLSGPKGTQVASGEPPVIRADQGPNKVVPSQPVQEPTSDGQKLIYDRVGGSPTTGNEQVVSSEEQPVDVSQAAQPQPRVIQTAPPAATPANAAEPKRVRTLTVRADGTIVEDGTDSAPTPVAAAPVQSSAQPTVSAPIPLNSGTGEPVSTDPTPLASTPSIVDNVSANSQPARVATAPTPAPAATSTPAPAGNYVVQIASVRSEAEAQSTWRSMQSKYPGILGNQPFAVRRADLGDRGVYYRAQVGSFSSRDGAVALCEALRAQGGDCMVQRN